MFANILIGLAGLGLVIIIHEYGHFVAARLVGVGVRVFSIGWGRKLFGFTRGETEYRISMLPIGGYVRLKGEEALTQAHEEQSQAIPAVPNGFFSVSPWRRIVIAVGGPLFNVIAALLIFTILFSIGYTFESYDNRVVLVSEFDQGSYPADEAGLRSGDRIVAINARPTAYFSQIRERIAEAGDNELAIEIERAGERLTLRANPQFDRDTGLTVLGVYPWVDPVIDTVGDGSAAAIAGLADGDRIVAVDGVDIEHGAQFSQALRRSSAITVTVLRDGSMREFRVPVGEDDSGNPEIGISFRTLTTRTDDLNVPQALVRSASEVVRVFRLTIRGIAALFSGVNVTNVVAGPIQLTSVIGDVTRSGDGGFWTSMRLLFHFLAVINIALCFMNMLPIPILDGGQILLYAWEAIRRKALRPRAIIRYQRIGGVCILILLVLALASDFFFLFS